MPGAGYLALAALILLLLPVVVLPWEGRRVPDWLYAAIAACGLAASAAMNGWTGALVSGASALAALCVVAAAVAAIRITLNLQIVTGGHIKLLAAGASWLGAMGTVAMLVIAFGALFAIAALQRVQSTVRRPDFTAIAALTILCVGAHQALL